MTTKTIVNRLTGSNQYKAGDIFVLHMTEVYILAMVSMDTMCLVGISDGNRYREPMRVSDAPNVTQEEMKILCGIDYRYIQDIQITYT